MLSYFAQYHPVADRALTLHITMIVFISSMIILLQSQKGLNLIRNELFKLKFRVYFLSIY